MKYCTNCGAKSDNEDKFCSKCGHKLKEINTRTIENNKGTHEKHNLKSHERTLKKVDKHPISTTITRIICYLIFGFIFIGSLLMLKNSFSLRAIFILSISSLGIFVSLPHFNTYSQNKFNRTFSTNAKGFFLLILLLLFIFALPENSTDANSSTIETSDIDDGSVQNANSGPFFTQNYKSQQKNEWEAMEACSKACEEAGGEYQSHDGSDAGGFYLLVICNCWRN